MKFLIPALLCFGAAQAETHFLYVRHGEVPGNDPSHYLYTGSGTNESLTEKGKSQAEECARTLSEIQKSGRALAAIYSSNLNRAVETARPIAEVLGVKVELRPNLREIDWGIANGQLVKRMTAEWGALDKMIHEQYPDRRTRWDHLPVFPGAETYNALLKRSLDEFKTFAERHPGETVLIVGHGRMLKTLIAEAQDSDEILPVGNCAIVEFTYSTDKGLQLVKIFE